jgi:hypothetical protein
MYMYYRSAPTTTTTPIPFLSLLNPFSHTYMSRQVLYYVQYKRN